MIITTTQMMDAIEEVLQATFPGEPVYENLTPRDFARPSNMVELTKLDLDALGQGLGAVTLR